MSFEPRAGELATDPVEARRLVGTLEAVYPLSFVTDSDAVVHWASDAWASLCGSQPPTDSLASLTELCQRHQLPSVQRRMQELGLMRSRLDLPEGNGHEGPLELSLFAVGAGDGSPPCHVAIARSARRRQSGAERLSILDSVPNPLIVADAQGFVTWANAAAEQLLGLAPEALEGCALAALAVDAEGLERLLLAFDSQAPDEFQLSLRGANTTLAAIARVAPHRHPDGHDEGIVLALREAPSISEIERLRRTEELEHCINTLAHDLRSPLVAVLGFSRLLRQDYGPHLDETGVHFLDRIEQAGRTMESLIHDLLELSRIGQPGDRPRLVDPRAVLLQLAAEFKPRLDDLGIQLFLPDDPPLVFCDRTRLYQVFSNLIGNAIEHMGECARRHIDVAIDERPEAHWITVRDFGRGVEPDQQNKIFEVFQTIGSSREAGRGTGMGLTIVRKIAETHGGKAWVESRPGEGAAFRLTLPRR